MTKLWLGKVGVLFRISKKRGRVSYFWHSLLFFLKGTLPFFKHLASPNVGTLLNIWLRRTLAHFWTFGFAECRHDAPHISRTVRIILQALSAKYYTLSARNCRLNGYVFWPGEFRKLLSLSSSKKWYLQTDLTDLIQSLVSELVFMIIHGHYMGIICEKRKPKPFIFNMNVHLTSMNDHLFL